MKAQRKRRIALPEAGARGAEPSPGSSAETKGWLHRIKKTLLQAKMLKEKKMRSLQLQALAGDYWWVLVEKELPRSSQILLGMCPGAPSPQGSPRVARGIGGQQSCGHQQRGRGANKRKRCK
ncbi:hypothetical protein llap_9781 [Limosa lapponica baueri]|uniref:Uncharacterized protein n=1 Tax=Limosa lapponica baueri TaxID=1758121 RepID=A0A2I0U1G2_LIMLA|nr:hypothetical protein llap_9781 [Limosa lapponica baueri]